jgi:LytS/YehU family sensor histidine kinase
MTIQLSDFLRYALSKSESNFNTLREELKNINLYLNIEKIRFGDKFSYIQNVSDELLDHEIPSMILQPIFENAIKHGVYESLQPIQLKLECVKRDNRLSIRLENNFESESNQNKGEGVGLKNIKDRLKLIYGYDGLLSIKKENNIFVVEIIIPQTVRAKNG